MKRRYQLLFSIMLYASFSIYLSLLLYLLIFQRNNFGGEQYVIIMRSVNLIPFRTIRIFLSGGIGTFDSFSWINILGNIIMFAPLGLYLPVMASGKKFLTYTCWILLFSLSAEILQWILGVGVSDIDDLILNGLGGILGLLAFIILLSLFKNEYRVRIFIAIFSNIVGIPALCIAVSVYLYNR